MAKSKTQSKPVKASAVTKSAPAAKAKASVVAKEVAKKADKKAKKVESSDEESDDDSASSASEDSSASDDESVEEKKKPVANGKANGKAKVEVDSDDSEDSDSDESDDAKPVTNGKAKTVNTKKAAAADSSDESASSDDDDSEEETKTTKAKAAEPSDDDSDGSEDSDESEEEEEEEKPVSKKRKAEEVATPQAKKQKAEANGNETKNLFVGSLSWNVDDGYLRSEFEKFGEIIRANVVTDRESGRSKGFGYVEFTNLEDAIKAHTEMTGAEIDGRAINVDFSQPRGDNANNGQRQQQRAKTYGDQPSEPSDTLFVGNLSFEADESVVGEAFAGYEGLKHIRLPTRPEDGTPKGFGYVQFNSVEEATAAHDGMSGAFISGRPIRLDYSQPRQNTGDSPRGGFGDRGGRGRGRGGFGDRGGRGRGRGGFGDRGGRGGGRGGSTNRGGFGSFQGKKMTF